jgi:hypothetical protein
MVDAQHAAHVVAVTDHLVPYTACPVDIAQDRVDFAVKVDCIGDAGGILSGTTRPTTDQVGLRIAADNTRVIEAADLLDDEFSFQTGAGGILITAGGQLTRPRPAGRRCGERHSCAGAVPAWTNACLRLESLLRASRQPGPSSAGRHGARR